MAFLVRAGQMAAKDKLIDIHSLPKHTKGKASFLPLIPSTMHHQLVLQFGSEIKPEIQSLRCGTLMMTMQFWHSARGMELVSL